MPPPVRDILPHARIVVDPFHVLQAALRAVSLVRRRVIFARYGRRGRSGTRPQLGGDPRADPRWSDRWRVRRDVRTARQAGPASSCHDCASWGRARGGNKNASTNVMIIAVTATATERVMADNGVHSARTAAK
jgi:hypothetical protein